MKNLKSEAVFILITSLSLFLSDSLFAQPGALDLSFGTAGIVLTDIGTSNDLGRGSALQNDGKIIVIGSSKINGTNDFILIRYNNDGSADSSFGENGIVITSFGVYDDTANAIAIQDDGKIVVAGHAYNGTNNDIAVARYNTDGSLDVTFDNDGKTTTSLGNGPESAQALLLQHDGKIVVTGYAYNGFSYDFALVRYNIDGSLDTTFDTDGKVVTHLGIGNDRGLTIAQQSDDKIVIGGYSIGANFSDFALLRFNPNGSLDTTFDTDGKVLTRIGNFNDIIYGIAIQSDGKIIAAGVTDAGTTNNNYNNFAIVRYNINGSLDTTFATNGIASIDFALKNDIAKSVVIQNDNKIIVAGASYYPNSIDDFALLRLNSNGSIDTTFGTNGKTSTIIGNATSEIANTILLQNDGKIILTGFSYSFSTNNYVFATARYNNDSDLALNASEIPRFTAAIAPNPFGVSATIKSNDVLENATLNIYNIFGQLVRTQINIFGDTVIIDRANLKRGVYLLQLTNKNDVIFTDKIFVTD